MGDLDQFTSCTSINLSDVLKLFPLVVFSMLGDIASMNLNLGLRTERFPSTYYQHISIPGSITNIMLHMYPVQRVLLMSMYRCKPRHSSSQRYYEFPSSQYPIYL